MMEASVWRPFLNVCPLCASYVRLSLHSSTTTKKKKDVNQQTSSTIDQDQQNKTCVGLLKLCNQFHSAEYLSPFFLNFCITNFRFISPVGFYHHEKKIIQLFNHDDVDGYYNC